MISPGEAKCNAVSQANNTPTPTVCKRESRVFCIPLLTKESPGGDIHRNGENGVQSSSEGGKVGEPECSAFSLQVDLKLRA